MTATTRLPITTAGFYSSMFVRFFAGFWFYAQKR